jgi:hypothetical protein
MAPTNTNQQQEPRRKVVVVPVLANSSSFSVVWALLAAVISAGAHVLLILILMNLDVGNANAVPTGEINNATVIEEETQEKDTDLTSTDIGLDSDVPTNFNVDRIEEVSVPGMVNTTESVGIVSAPEGPAKTLPAPPGTGQGTGMAPMMADAGAGSMYGTIGGMSGLTNLGGFGGRSGATRQKMLMEGGGNKESEACVAKGLSWLARHQSQDGRWSLNEFHQHAREKPYPAGSNFKCDCTGMAGMRDDQAATAFALLPFLAAGITHRPSAKEKQAVEYNKTVLKGVEFLMKKQGKDGAFEGGMYSHGLVTIAMCEAYGLTSDPILKKSAQAALDYIEKAQDPAGGGWRYTPRSGGDTSVVGWQLMGLKSGQMSGLTVKTKTLTDAEKFLNSCESQDGGGYSYVPPGNSETPTMTSVGLLCRMYLGIGPRNPRLLRGIDRLTKQLPSQTTDLYYLYYATQVMHHMGGDAWEKWNKGPDGQSGKGGIRDTLIGRMDNGTDPKHKHLEGSWSPENSGAAAGGGRIMSTSLSLLCLEVYYRHLPLYRRDMGIMKGAEKGAEGK